MKMLFGGGWAKAARDYNLRLNNCPNQHGILADLMARGQHNVKANNIRVNPNDKPVRMKEIYRDEKFLIEQIMMD